MLTLRELAILGRDMRAAQTRYFKSRAPGDLEASKRLERDFDRACSEAIEPGLFAAGANAADDGREPF